jgi:EAL domain-containing protein (putative c-di-GMP-specific phosphodiesterase class I)
VTVGFALAFHNPLITPDRLVTRLVEEAWSCVRVLRAQRELQDRCDLRELLLADQLSTVFQPVVALRSLGLLGYEALTRGPGSVHQMPQRLFELAEQVDLVFELDRKYRRRSLAAAAGLPGASKLAEGIEREAELQTLLDLGIEYGQGFLLGRPASSLLPPAGSQNATVGA